MTVGELMLLLEDVTEFHGDDPIVMRSPNGWQEVIDMVIEPERIVMVWGPVTE